MEDIMAFLESFYNKSRGNVSLYDKNKKIIWSKEGRKDGFFPDSLDEIITSEELGASSDTVTQMLGGDVITIKTFPHKTGEGEAFYLCEAFLLSDFIEEHYPLLSRGLRKTSSVFRQQIFGVINLASSLYASCEKVEMYEEIAKLIADWQLLSYVKAADEYIGDNEIWPGRFKAEASGYSEVNRGYSEYMQYPNPWNK